MKALGIIILSGLFIMMIISVIYIYWKSCMTMLGSAFGLTVLLLAEIATFIQEYSANVDFAAVENFSICIKYNLYP